jgi:hypothetical protein
MRDPNRGYEPSYGLPRERNRLQVFLYRWGSLVGWAGFVLAVVLLAFQGFSCHVSIGTPTTREVK